MKPEWRRSTSSDDAGDCAEVAFVKSSFTDAGNCVEVALGQPTAVRDSKNPAAVLTVPLGTWRTFLRLAAGR